MRISIVILILALASGCATVPGQTYMEVGVGHNDSYFNENNRWQQDDGPGFYGSIRQEFQSKRHERISGFLQYSHYSQWFAGPPFNDEAESSLDHLGAGLRFRVGD